MTTFNKKSFQPLDSDEKRIMDSIERDKWKSVPDLKKQKNEAIQAAKNTLKKDKRINLRLSQ